MSINRNLNFSSRSRRLSVPPFVKLVWQRIPFAWALQMTIKDHFHRRSLRAIRLVWLGNEVRPSTIESSYLLLHPKYSDRFASRDNPRRQLDSDTLMRAQDAARRTH